MPKLIVGRAEINLDPKLKIVNDYRIANQKAGRAKRAQNREAFEAAITEMNGLTERAEAAGFHIWVNESGKTGHSYGKDYKATPDEDNNWESANARIQAAQQAMENMGRMLGAHRLGIDGYPDDGPEIPSGDGPDGEPA